MINLVWKSYFVLSTARHPCQDILIDPMHSDYYILFHWNTPLLSVSTSFSHICSERFILTACQTFITAPILIFKFSSWAKRFKVRWKQFYRFSVEIWLVIVFIKVSYFQWLGVFSVRNYGDCTFIQLTRIQKNLIMKFWTSDRTCEFPEEVPNICTKHLLKSTVLLVDKER